MISCTILYPEQFDALRRTYDCEKSIVESLSRCVKWDANGGKSGSAFLKTRGLRAIQFVCSGCWTNLGCQMTGSLRKSSRVQNCKRWKLLLLRTLTIWHLLSAEMYVVHLVVCEKWVAQSYDQRPTLLAKVFGCYKLTFKKVKDKETGKAKVTHMNLFVMENLFYNRRFAKV